MTGRVVAVIGAGAIGGSLALDLDAAGANVTAYDIDAATVADVRNAGLSAELWHGRAPACDVVIIAVPVRRTATVLSALAQRDDYVLVTDVGSTKRFVIQAAQREGLGSCFVGSHPFAGTERSGWAAARRGMFIGKTVFVTPTAQSSARAIDSANELWHSLGALPERIAAEDHDARLAWASHLPQLTANALALVLESAGVARGDLGPGGRDMTRLSGSEPSVWLDILASNADMLDEPLGRLIDALTEVRQDLVGGNEDALLSLLRRSASWHHGRPV